MKNKNNQKKPIAIILLLSWIVYMIFRGVLKLINLGKIEQNKQIFGKFAIINYWIDAAVLAFFILIIILFIKRRPSTWKYILGIVIFLMIGTIIGQVFAFIFIDNIILLVGQGLPSTFFLVSSIISTIFLLAFYSLVLFLAYKSKFYFNK